MAIAALFGLLVFIMTHSTLIFYKSKDCEVIFIKDFVFLWSRWQGCSVVLFCIKLIIPECGNKNSVSS